MASSTSLEGDLDSNTYSRSLPKSTSRSRQRGKNRSSDQRATMERTNSAFLSVSNSNGVTDPVPERITSNRSPSSNKNLRYKRNLREKRRPTGVVNILSTESAGGTSSGTDDDALELDDDLNVKTNTKLNEVIPFAGGEVEKNERGNKGAHRSGRKDIHSLTLKTENERLKDQLRFKEKYIKQLEQKVLQLEIQNKGHPPHPHPHVNSPKKRMSPS